MTAGISLTLDSEELALRYERDSADRQFRSGQTLIDALDIRPGEHVLDVGAGTGLLAAYVADIVGPSGSVVGIDPLEHRIEIAKRKARANLIFAVGNAQDLSEFAPGSLDVVYLNSVFHWLPDQPGALRQFFRVLKPGGRLGISTGSGNHPYALQLIKARLFAKEPFRDHQESKAALPVNLTKQELETLLDQTGFHRRSVTFNRSVNLAPDTDSMINFFEASAFGNFLGHLPDDLRRPAFEEVKRELEAYRTDDRIEMELIRLVAVATRPENA